MLGCDLGSNTLRVVKIDCKTKERVKEFEKIVKTAQGIEAAGEISQKTLDRVIEAILEAKKNFDDCENANYKAVATAALRMAKNAAFVIETIYAKTGIFFEIIDSKKEAEYTRVAVENRLKKLKQDTKSYILLDLGGGSCEVVVKYEDEVICESFDIGIVTVVEKYGLRELEKGIKRECAKLASFAKSVKKKPDIFIGSSGTPTTIASFLSGIDYEHYDYRKVNGFVLSRKDMKDALRKLISMDKEERIRWVGVGREELIVAGVKLLYEIVYLFGYEKLTVIDDGLREGAAIVNCNKQNFNTN